MIVDRHSHATGTADRDAQRADGGVARAVPGVKAVAVVVAAAVGRAGERAVDEHGVRSLIPRGCVPVKKSGNEEVAPGMQRVRSDKKVLCKKFTGL